VKTLHARIGAPEALRRSGLAGRAMMVAKGKSDPAAAWRKCLGGKGCKHAVHVVGDPLGRRVMLRVVDRARGSPGCSIEVAGVSGLSVHCELAGLAGKPRLARGSSRRSAI